MIPPIKKSWPHLGPNRATSCSSRCEKAPGAGGRRRCASPLLIGRCLFPGGKKITPGLTAVLLTPGATAPVIATLDTKAGGQALKQQVQKLLKTLPPGSFTPRGSFGRIPVLTGKASLPGLMALAASPLVKAIQSDEKALPTPSAGLAVPSGEVLK